MSFLPIAGQALARISRRAIIALVGVAVVLAMGTGVAFAYFRSTGNGTGRANVGSLVPVTVLPGTTAGTALYPGDTSSPGDLEVKATNPNPVDLKVTVTGITSTSCGTPSLSLVGQPTFTIPKNTTSATAFPLTGAVTMGTDASSDCQGKTLTATLTVTVQQ